MRYKLLGNSGLRVSELCLGSMTFGEDWGWGASRDEAKRMFAAFADAGGNFIDTANVYTNGTSEKLVGELIESDRDHFVLGTKFVSSTRRGDPNAAGSHRKNLVQALEASLRRLRTDRIDFYWVHLWDFLTRPEEVMRALDDQVRAGKILYVGASDTPAWCVAECNTLAALRGWTPFSALQIEYSLVERGAERELIPMARSLGLGVTAWSPLAAGLLTGKYVDQTKDLERGGRLDKLPWDRRSERNLKIAALTAQIAREVGHSPAQVALNWLRQRPTPAIPILGARRSEQLLDNLSCLKWRLDASIIARLDAETAIDLGFPSNMISHAADFVYGGTFDVIDGAHERSPVEFPSPRLAAE